MTKQPISATLDENLLLEIERQIATGRFRNKNHAIEFLITKALEQEKGGDTNGEYPSSQSSD